MSVGGISSLFGNLITRLLERRVTLSSFSQNLLRGSALTLFDSAKIIEDPLTDFRDLAPISVSRSLGHPPVCEAIEEVLDSVSRVGFATHFPEFIGMLGALQVANSGSEAQQVKIREWVDAGYRGAFLMTDRGGPTLDQWQSQASITGSRHELVIDKIWSMFALNADFLTVVVKREGAMLPVAYLLDPSTCSKLERAPQGAAFINGTTQLASVKGVAIASDEDILASGGPLGVSRFLCQARPRFVLGAIAHVLWLIEQGRANASADIRDMLCALRSFARSVVEDNQMHRHAIDEVLALKFAMNEAVLAIVKADSSMAISDQRDLLGFSKLEGSSYHCLEEIYSRSVGQRHD